MLIGRSENNKGNEADMAEENSRDDIVKTSDRPGKRKLVMENNEDMRVINSDEQESCSLDYR